MSPPWAWRDGEQPGCPQPGRAVKSGLVLLLWGKRSHRIETCCQPGLACFSTQAKTLINAPAMTQNASRAEKRGDSHSGGGAAGLPPPALGRPLLLKNTPLSPSQPRHTLLPPSQPRHTPRHPRGCAERQAMLYRASAGARLKGCGKGGTFLMIRWHKAVLISLRNGNEV